MYVNYNIKKCFLLQFFGKDIHLKFAVNANMVANLVDILFQFVFREQMSFFVNNLIQKHFSYFFMVILRRKNLKYIKFKSLNCK